MSKQKVLFIVPVLRRAGAESQLVTLVNRLPGNQFEKHLLSYRPGDDLSSDVNATDVKRHQLHRKNKLDLPVGREIGKIIDEYEIDVIHCTLLNALLYGLMGSFFANRNPGFICVIHTTENADMKHEIADQLLYRQLLKRCEQIWFVSTTQAERWIRKMPFIAGRNCTIHNGIDLDYFDPALFETAGHDLRKSLGISDEEKVLCSVAGFRSEKLHTVLIDAVHRVRSEGTPCRLLLAGVGPMEQAIRDKVIELNLEESVVFLGSLSDVRSLLAAADCKVLVSAAETFSMAMLEAMAMEVPVITTTVGGAAEAIEDGVNGMLVCPGDAGHLAARIKSMLDNNELRRQMGRLARQIVVERFGVEKMVAESAEQIANISVAC
jgi:glycosyltransferase involved in cell wall biosynthesis